MCGIAGVFNYGLRAGMAAPENLIRMRDIMVHRGPDSGGLYVSPDGRVGMAFRRLSIIDLSEAGNQPMCNEDGTLWITFNGEVYNHAELRAELIAKGHVYKSHTDTETVLHLFEEYGIEALQRLEGMYAFALWDSRRGKMIFARDRIGIKPLYFTFADGAVLYASEIKALLEHPSVKADLDPIAMYHYLTFVTTPAPTTLFAGIQKLPAGHYLEIDHQGNSSLHRYWDAIVPRSGQPKTEAEYIEQVRWHLKSSVRKHMMSDVPFGAFLSGGIDSSTITALMAAEMNRPVDTFTVGFKQDEQYNELEYARQVAREFNTNHHEVMIDQQDLIDFLPQLIFHQDEPIADPVCVPLYYVSKLVRDSGTIVVQVGEGSDELFFGYASYMMFLNTYNKRWRPFQQLPGWLRSGAYKASLPLMELTGKGKFNDFLRRGAAGEELFWGGAIAFYELDKQPLVTPAYRQMLGGLSSHSVVREYYGQIEGEKDVDYMEKMIYLELKLRLSELLLMRVDKITMATSIEARVPFLDHKLVEMAMNIPADIKINGGLSKSVLKKAVEGIIPHNIIYRKKMGFGAPISEWLFRGFGDYVEQRLMHSTLRERGLLDYDHIAHLLAAHRSGKVNHAFQLWNLLNLSLWHDYWIAGKRDF